MARKPYTLDWLIKNYLKFFAGDFGMEEGNIRRYYQEWSAKAKNDSVGDYLWHLFHELLDRIPKASLSPELYAKYFSEVYYKMWEFMVYHENRPANDCLQLGMEYRLIYEEQTLPFKFDVKISSGHCCPYCDSLNGMMVTLQQVYQNKYLASHKCTRPSGCNCRYASVPKRRKDGSLVLNR
ncbi:MAG: hypothetical protein EOO16_00380 [Chitinophagaceae bacterium]|nr:MAG: hypothetical protein EOO16_00380 [Chitinophagaceae bacterium]